MKREGRQHGMVRTYRVLPSPWNPRSESRFVQQFDSPSTAGLFTNVSVKPTNHSKFTGRCGRPRCVGCHMHPTCKSKNKTKGNNKLRSGDVVTNYRLVFWRVVEGKPRLKYSEHSATRILDHLSKGYEEEDDDYNHDHDQDDDDDDCGVVNDGFKMNPHHSLKEKTVDYDGDEFEETNGIISDDDKREAACIDDDDDVKYVLDQKDLEDDESWCLVGEF